MHLLGVPLLLSVLAVVWGCAAPHYGGPVIDVHTHVFFDGQGGGATGMDGSPTGLLEQARSPRLSQVGVIVMAPAPGMAATRRLNDQLAEFIRRDPSRLFGIGTVHPADGAEAVSELRRLRGLGFRMVKLHPNTQRFDVASPEVATVVSAATELGMPVLFDFSGLFQAAELGKYVMLAVTNPKARIILAHMGGTKFHDLLVLAALREHASFTNNLWVDLSAVAHLYADSPYRDQLVFVIRKIGVDRVLFGSDFPFDRTPAAAVSDVEALGLTVDEERQILHDNAAALLK